MRYSIRCDSELQELLQIIASTIGSPTNPSKLENTFKSVKNVTLSSKTINTYLSYLEDAFLIEKSIRYDIKGKIYKHASKTLFHGYGYPKCYFRI